MSAQTTMSNDPAVAYEGMIAQVSGYTVDIISKVMETAAGESAGRFVRQGTADNQCKAITAIADVTDLGKALGFLIYDPSKPTNWPPSAYSNANQVGSMCAILRRGRIWLITEEAVTPLDDVYVRAIAGTPTVIGRVGTSSDSSKCGLLAQSQARFMTTAAAGALVLVEINLP